MSENNLLGLVTMEASCWRFGRRMLSHSGLKVDSSNVSYLIVVVPNVLFKSLDG